jgi:molecular chaperone GrpE
VNATADVARNFLPALDDIDRAQTHGDLEEGRAFSAVAQKLRAAAEKLGLERVGEKGEAFDPTRHDALVQTSNPEVSQAVVADVVEVGYRIGEKEIRPAKVAVFVPVEE